MDPAVLTISPLKIKAEDDDSDIIDLDIVKTAEDLVYEWNTKIRLKLKYHYLVEGEETLNMLMKWYIQSLKEEAVNMEDIKSLKPLILKHLQFFKLYFDELNCCFIDNYLENMEDILAVYLKIEIKLAPRKRLLRKRICHRIISTLSSLLINKEDRVYHVLMKVKLGLLSEDSKDMLNILFRKMLTKQPKDKSDLAFCRSYILYQKWKTCRKSHEWEKMDEVIYNLYDQSPDSVRNNATLKKILFPQSKSVLDTLIHFSEKHIIISEEYFKHVNSMKLQEETVDLPELREIEINDPILPDLVEDDEDREFYAAYNNFVQSMSALSGQTSKDTDDGAVTHIDDDDDECQIVGIVAGGTDSGTDLVHEILEDGDIEIIYLKKKTTQGVLQKERNQCAPSSFLDSIDITEDAEIPKEVIPDDVEIQTQSSEGAKENVVDEASLPSQNALVNIELGSQSEKNEISSVIVPDNVEVSRENLPNTEIAKEDISNNLNIPSDKVSSSTSTTPVDQPSVVSFASTSTNTNATDRDSPLCEIPSKIVLHAPSPCSMYSPCNVNMEASSVSKTTKRCSKPCTNTQTDDLCQMATSMEVDDYHCNTEACCQGVLRSFSAVLGDGDEVRTTETIAYATIETEEISLVEQNLDSSGVYEIVQQAESVPSPEATLKPQDIIEASMNHDSNLVSESCCIEISGNLSPISVNPVVYKSPDTNNGSDSPNFDDDTTLRGSSPNIASSVLCTSTDITTVNSIDGNFSSVQSKSVTLPCPSPDITSTSTEIQDLRKSPPIRESSSEVYYDNPDNVLEVEEYPHNESSFTEEYLIYSNCDMDNSVNNDNISQSNLQDNEEGEDIVIEKSLLIQNEVSSNGGSICSPTTSGGMCSPETNLECVQPETIGISEVIIDAVVPMEIPEETAGANRIVYASSEKVKSHICDFYKFEENHHLNISNEAATTNYGFLNADFDVTDSNISSIPQEHAPQTPTSSSANSSSDVISPAYEQMDDFGRYYEERKNINMRDISSPEKSIIQDKSVVSRTLSKRELDFNITDTGALDVSTNRGKKRSSNEAPRRKPKKIRIAEVLVGSSHSVPNFPLQNAPIPQGILKMTSSYDTQTKEPVLSSKAPDSTKEEVAPKRKKLEFIDVAVKMCLLPDDQVIHVLSLNDVSQKFREEKEQAQCSSSQRIVRIDYKTTNINENDVMQSSVPNARQGMYDPNIQVISGLNSYNLLYTEKKNAKRKGQSPVSFNGRSWLVSRKKQEIGLENSTRKKPGRKRKKGFDT